MGEALTSAEIFQSQRRWRVAGDTPIIPKILTLLFLSIYAVSASAQLNFEPKTLHKVYGHADGFYSYAPSIIDAGDTRYLWTCHNHDPFLVRDDIVMSTLKSGRLTEDRSVLVHSFFGWDSFHICDPSVMRTDITFNKTAYHWAMFFLGNNVDRSAQNQIGVALAQTIQGPWEKLAEPVLRHVEDGGWGIGQPSALPLDGKGKFLVIYSGTGLHAAIVDLSQLDHITTSNPVDVTTDGLEKLSALKWPLSNMDIAYSPDRKRIFAVADIKMAKQSYPAFITSRLAVLSIDTAHLEQGGGTWRVEATLGPELTGFPRNHNAGLARNADGVVTNPDRLGVIFTRSCAAGSNFPCNARAEWTYDLWEISAPIH